MTSCIDAAAAAAAEVRYLAVDDERHLVVAVQVLAVLAHVRLEYFPHTLQPQPYGTHASHHANSPTYCTVCNTVILYMTCTLRASGDLFTHA